MKKNHQFIHATQYTNILFLYFVQAKNAHSWTCMDLYVFATPYRVTWDYYFLSREHTFEFDEWEGKEEYEHVSCDHNL